MTELELLLDFHLEADRQGPGSREDTIKALSFVDIPRDTPLKIADIGCGSGAQTVTLAEQLSGRITAVDLFPAFLDKLRERAGKLKLKAGIETMEGDMNDLGFAKESFDLIWSEGAIYSMGFEAGVKNWRRFLKPGGYLAVSEITWKTAERPREIEEHWNGEYPEIDTASAKLKILEDNGFSPAVFFFLPESSWLDSYYTPMEKRFEPFLQRHHYSEEAKSLVEAEKEEIRLSKTYSDFVSYGFYVARKGRD